MSNEKNASAAAQAAPVAVKEKAVPAKKRPKKNKKGKLTFREDIKRNWQVYLIFLPAFLFFLVLSYFPMFGIVMAFQNFKIAKGFFGSEFIGLANFKNLFADANFLVALRNTVCIALLKISLGFIAPVAFAVLLSLLLNKRYRRIVQTLSYLPNFISAVVVCAILTSFLQTGGPISLLVAHLTNTESSNLLANSNIPVFWLIYIFMGIWQGMGWGSITYMASISSVNGELYEAAAIDGANQLQRMFKITLPCIMPMIVMMFVMNVGLSFTVGYDNILLLYMPSTYNVSDTVYTYTYRLAFTAGNQDYGLSAASGLFQSVIGTILLVGSNKLSKKLSGSSLF